jgi:hypothetical protein
VRGIALIASWHAEVWIALGTIIIAVFTVILGTATIFLWRATRDLVDGTEKTAKTQLRAYVFPKEPRIVGLFVEGGETKATCKLQNFGQTPAYEMVCAATVYISTDPPETVIVPGAIGLSPMLDLGPGGSITITRGIQPLSEVEIADIKDGKRAIYFSGNIAYRDTFKNCQTATFLLMKSKNWA